MSNPPAKAQAYPTKEFFVSMLTRDIKLEDAILDLVDNCLDGALRMANGRSVDYSQHLVTITMTDDVFVIEDNCGGIPREVAAKYAFKMGREASDNRDAESETIGMYGVGMKRAIFKMGTWAKVETSHQGDNFEVDISPTWLADPAWSELDIVNSMTNDVRSGTRITVRSLFPNVSHHFRNSAFENGLRASVSEHFTMFLQRGLKIVLNEKPIPPVKVEVLVFDDETQPAPFVYEKLIQDVTVSITVGLNRSVQIGGGDEDETDEEESAETDRERSSATAGWTVFCNDRAVIVGDKSRLTGWGDGIPLYHPQFAIITGIVEFRSSNAKQLPITTTKRALDANSEIWLEALVKMKEGMRVWTSYTNAWKNYPRAEQTKLWGGAKPLPVREVVSKVGNRTTARKQGGTIEYNPSKKSVLPQPPHKTVNTRRIVFIKPIPEIKELSEHLFETPDTIPSEVGQRCFEVVLSQARKSDRKP